MTLSNSSGLGRRTRNLRTHNKTILNKLHRLTERDSRLAHYFALFWGLGLCLSYLALPVQNLTSYSCSVTPISYKGDDILCVSRNVFEIPFWGIFAGLGLLLGYLASSGAKSDVVFLLSDALSYKGDKISRVSRIIFDIPFWGILGFGAHFGVFS